MSYVKKNWKLFLVLVLILGILLALDISTAFRTPTPEDDLLAPIIAEFIGQFGILFGMILLARQIDKSQNELFLNVVSALSLIGIFVLYKSYIFSELDWARFGLGGGLGALIGLRLRRLLQNK